MKRFKENWEITQNWQLIFPVLGLVGLGFSSYRLVALVLKHHHISLYIVFSLVIFFVLLKFVLKIFNRLQKKWNVKHRWEMITIFLVFAITGSSSVFISRPLIKLMGVTQENLSPIVYWVLYILLGFIFYQILLVILGWLFGQKKFFWDFEKKMLQRFGLFKTKK